MEYKSNDKHSLKRFDIYKLREYLLQKILTICKDHGITPSVSSLKLAISGALSPDELKTRVKEVVRAAIQPDLR